MIIGGGSSTGRKKIKVEEYKTITSSLDVLLLLSLKWAENTEDCSNKKPKMAVESHLVHTYDPGAYR